MNLLKTFRLAGLLTVALAGCNNDVKLEPLPTPPAINSFKASQAVVAKGSPVTLEWNTSDALTVAITEVGVGPVAGVDNQRSGSTTVTINADALFVLSATNKRGVKVTAPVTVALQGASARASFAALPGLIPAGGSATLVWSAPGARVITITPAGGAALDLKGQGDLGSLEVKPAATTLYTLAADGTQQQATVAVGQALVEFTVDKTLGLPGDTVVLGWKTSGATKVIVSAPSRGALLTETDPAKMASGTLSDVLPALPLGTIASYLLSVEGAGPVQTQLVSVGLNGPPEIKTFTAPQYARIDQQFTLGWTTLKADVVELSTGGVVFWTAPSAAQAVSGTLLVDSPSADAVYTLTARSAFGGGTVSRTVTVKPVGAATVTTFTALPATVAAGGSAVTLSWNVPGARRLKISGSDGHTVASARGVAAETGTALAYPNGAITYTLDADNTLEPAVTATQAVTVTAPAAFGPATVGPVFAGNPISLNWTVGTNAQLVGFPHADVVADNASTGFVDISTTGTALGFTATADDSIQTFTPPDFESFIFGNRVSGPVTVSTNGFFAFAASTLTRSTTVAIPNTTIERNFIAPFWANLELAGVGKVYWQVINEAPERILVVQFEKVKVKGEAASELSFEAKVHQTGVISFEYKKLQTAALPTHVIGVQGAVAGLAAGGPAANVGLTLFGPKSAPQPVTFDAPAAQGGFLKLASGYLKVAYAPPTFVAPGAIGITEVMYDPAPAIATTGEWFEVVNTLPTPLDLNGWTIDFGGPTHAITNSLIVPANGTLLLGQSAAGPLNDDVATGYVYGTTFSLGQPTGSLQLKLINYGATSSWDSAIANNGGVGVSVGVDPNRYLLSTDTTGTPPHPISCSSTASFGSQTPLQLGSPGTTAGCFGYGMQSIPVSYLDISGTGVITTTGDESVGTLDLTAAPVSYFGAARTTAKVSTNGWVSFRTTATSAVITNRTLPSTTATNAGTVSIFWDDLNDTNIPTSNVYSKRIAAGEDPNNPGAHWIVQWGHYTHYTKSDDLNFQVKFFDTGVIEYHYATMISGDSSSYANGNSATVWLESYDGSAALISSINQPVVLPNSALRFTPN